MSTYDRLRYDPIVVAAGATVQITRSSIGGFVCTTTGTITLVRNDGNGATTTLLNALPVTEGQFIHLPIYLGNAGATLTSASAVGVLLT